MAKSPPDLSNRARADPYIAQTAAAPASESREGAEVDERDDAGESPCPARPDAVPAPDDQWVGLPRRVPEDDWDGLPRCAPEDDFDADAEMARWVADLEAGRDRIPDEWERDGLGVCLSPGDACDLDPAALAATLDPGGLGGQSPGPAFAQNH